MLPSVALARHEARGRGVWIFIMARNVGSSSSGCERFGILRIVITFRLRPVDLAGTRFAFSPLWECLAAFREWQAPRSQVARREWSAYFAAAGRDDDWPLLRALALGPTGAIPDFLAPPPAHPLVRFADEIAALRATPAAIVAAELGRALASDVPSKGTLLNTARSVERLATELTAFWRLVIAPLWPRILACLEAEVVYRSRILAFAGTRAVLENLHPAVSFVARGGGGDLCVRSGGAHLRRAARNGVLLVPSVFAWPDVYAVARAPWRPTITYPAQGVAELWLMRGRQRTSTELRLAALVGAARARIIRLLARPRTTLELATALHACPSTTSAHLSNLRAAGVVDRMRAGRRVLYSLSERGRAIVRATELPV
jgi:DNA-binding transcriptional ArsR family regulator